MPAAEMSDKTLLAVAPSSPPPLGHETRGTAAQCKWHSGVIQSPASLHFPDQPQARSDRKVTTSLAWLGSRKTGDTGEWKYLPHIYKMIDDYSWTAQAEARKRGGCGGGAWRPLHSSSSYNVLNTSLHSLDCNYLNHHPAAKYFSNRKSRSNIFLQIIKC